jgi:hypothetical protein
MRRWDVLQATACLCLFHGGCELALLVVSWSSWGQVNRYCAAVFLISASVQGYREWSSLQTDSPRMFTAEDVAPVLESLTATFLCGQASEWGCEERKACVRSTQQREESRSRSK